MALCYGQPMRKNIRFIASLICSLSLVIGLGLLASCDWVADANQTSQWNPKDYFDGPTAELAEAAMHGDAKEVTRLIKEEGVNPDTSFGKDGMPLLAWPILTENPEGLKALLDNGADPNARMINKTLERGQNLDNAMVMAAGWPNPVYLEMLLKHGGDPNTKNSNNDPLLLEAFLKQRQWPNIQLLVLHGANVNETWLGEASTVLSQYSYYANFEEVYWLLQHGADPTLRMHGKIHPPEGSMIVVDDIYWQPTTVPANIEWQRKCQHWLSEHGIKRSEKMPAGIKSDREQLGFPTDEKNIPLL